MKHAWILAAALVAAGCQSPKSPATEEPAAEAAEQPAAKSETDQPEPAGQEMVKSHGIVTQAAIVAANPEWGELADQWAPNAGAVETISGASDVRIDVYLGTWCGDSRREVSRWFSVMNKVSDGPEVRYISLDRSMSAADVSIPETLTNVPTFYVYRGDDELGRVVETAVEPIGVDIADLISGKRSGFISASVDAP